MGGIGRCCCLCECLPIEDLPAVTISGYTGQGWTGDCCYEQIFTPNSASWSKSCSGNIYESTATENCVTEHWIQYGPNYRGFEFFPGGCDEIPEDYCCFGSSEKIVQTTTNWAFTDYAFMAVWTRPNKIIVRISQEDVDCSGVEGETGGCKIVIRSRFVYDWRSKIYGVNFFDVDQSAIIYNETCFELNDDYVFDIEDINKQSIATCSDVPSEPPSPTFQSCVYEGEFYFDRVRYYDDMPTGSITFTNANVPGCDSSGCEYEPYSYVSQVCINSPSGAINNNQCRFSEPCFCAGTVSTRDLIATPPDTICEGNTVTEVDNCTGEGLCNTLTTSCRNPGDPPHFSYDCNDGIGVNVLGYYIDDCFGTSGIGSDGYMPGTTFIDTPNGSRIVYSGCGGCTGEASCYQRNQQDTANVAPYNPLFDCSQSPCDQDCCFYFDDCPNCYPDGICVEKYSRPYSTVTAHTRSQTCSGISQKSVCLGAPQWTIVLS